MRARLSTSPDAAALLSALQPDSRRALSTAIEVAEGLGAALYLVGGGVRDLLLGGSTRDLDLAVEGSAADLAAELAARLGGDVRCHGAFGTAVVTVPLMGALDLATCRSEIYPAPGALPRVGPAGISEDLARRDFTVNAVALRLTPPSPISPWIDPFGGRADLEARRLRVLHAGSFRDDPTRILRGVRLAERLRFDFDPESEELARTALADGAMTTLSGDRLREELLPTLALGSAAVERLERLGVLAALDPDLSWSPAVGLRLDATVAQVGGLTGPCVAAGVTPPNTGWSALLALVWELDRAVRLRLAARLGLTGRAEGALVGVSERVESALAALVPGARPHGVVEALDRLSGDDLGLLGALGGRSAGTWIGRYLGELRRIVVEVEGDALVALGVPRGPELGRLLTAIRRARLDGEVVAGGELEFARRWLAMRQGAV